MAVIKMLRPSVVAEPAPAVAPPVKSTTPTAGKSDANKGKFRDHYQEVTDQIIEAIENGTAPWQKPWDARASLPVKAATGKPYHGVNVVSLLAHDYQDPRWCSYQQAQNKGWQVRKGEQGARVYFYKVYERETGEIDPVSQESLTKKFPVLRSYTVFNLSQMDGPPPLEGRREGMDGSVSDVTQAICDEIIEASQAEIGHGYRSAAYSPTHDKIFMPNRDSFASDGDYYATLLHELAHWSGHQSRMARVFGSSRDSPEYAREELRAEIASTMIGAKLGLPGNIQGHGAYVHHYLDVLREDKKEFFRACKDAERMADYVLSFYPQFREEIEEEHAARLADHKDAGASEEFFDASDLNFDELPGNALDGMKP